MKNKILILIFILFTLFIVGCTEESVKMYIESSDTVIINEYLDMKVYYNNEEVSSENLEWTLSDYNIASIENNQLYAKAYGKVTVTVIDMNNPTHYCAKQVEVVPPYVTDIKVKGAKEVMVGKTIYLEASIVPSIIESEIIWSSSNEEIIVVENGEVYAVGVGTAEVILVCDDFEKRYQITVNPEPTSIEIHGKNKMYIDEVISFTYSIEDEIALESSNSEIVEVIDNYILAKSIGTVVITAYKKSNPSVKGTIEVTVNDKNTTIDADTEEQKQIDEIISKLTTEQLVGQMFSVGFEATTNRWDSVPIEPSTGLPYVKFGWDTPQVSVLEYFKDYKFGNFNIKETSGTNRETLKTAIKTLTTLGKTNTNVKPLINIDYAGGKAMNGLNAIPVNQSIANTNLATVNIVNKLFSEELKSMGINSVKNLYLNTNPEINDMLCTYGTNPSKALATAKIISDAYKSNNVIMIPDLSVSNAYVDERSSDEVNQTDLKLLAAAIKNGAEIISVPFTSYVNVKDEAFCLSEYYMQEYLRKELNYKGVVMLDNSVISSFVYDENLYTYIKQAINLGVDMISFDITFSANPWQNYEYRTELLKGIYDNVLASVNDGSISIDRVKEAVSRILLVKIRNNVLSEEEVKEINYEEQKEKISNYMGGFISVTGDLYKLEKTEKILLISQSYSSTGTTASLGDSFRSYFDKRNYTNTYVYHTDTLTPQTVKNAVKNYDKVFVAVSSISDKTQVGFGASKENYISFINELKTLNPNICIIYTGSPDMDKYFTDYNNSIYLYNFYEEDFESLFRVLSQEIEPNIKEK